MTEKIPIENCRLKFECRQRWDSLEAIPSQPLVRYCGQCQSAVHLVRNHAEFKQQAAAGRCVAIRFPGRPMLIGATLGVPYDEKHGENAEKPGREARGNVIEFKGKA